MKQSFGKTLLSCFLTVTLMASVIAGAISVSVLHASADTIDSVSAITFSDFWDLVLDDTNVTSRFSSSDLQTFFNYVNPKIADIEENENYFCFACHDSGTSKWAVTLYQSDVNYMWSYNINNTNNGIGYHSISNVKFHEIAKFTFDGNGGTLNQNYVGSNSRYVTRTSAFSYGSAAFFPTTHDFNVSGRLIYSSSPVTDGNFNDLPSWSCSQNLLYAYPAPEIVDFDLVKFKLGERTYLTTKDQNVIFGTQPLDDTYLWWYIGFMQEDGSDYTSVILEYRDLNLIPGADAWLNVGLQNVHSQGVLAYDITDLLNWHDIWDSEFFWIYDPPTGNPAQYTPYAQAVNVPFLLGDDPNGQPDSYTQAWDQFNTYVTNYNTTHVIPEQLSDWIFDTDGAKLFPVTVQVPHAIWMDLYHSSDAPDNHVWRWGGLLAEEHGFQYSLYDTVIIGPSNAGYVIRYFYSDTLDPMYQKIEYMALENVLDSFDVVIIVPDSDFYLDPISMGSGYTGETGVVYVPDSAELVGNNWTGFAIVTEKAIAKQQLWNFNEGISKLYKLEVDYIDSEDKWKDSFLLWSASMFDMVNSLDGRLSDILVSITSLSMLVDQIRTTLNDIAADPDPDEVKPWYLSLWLFMKQFEPSNSQISEGLGYLVDNIDDIPLLPALTPVPALPTPGGD